MLSPCSERRSKTLKRKRGQKVEGEDRSHHQPHVKEKVSSNPSVRAPVVFVLESATLNKGFVRKRWKILNSGEDSNYLLKKGEDLKDYQPEIVYGGLRAIFDSKLNKAGMIGAVYVQTDKGLLFEIKPHTRIPRTCKRFCGLMLELLDKSSVRAAETNESLIRVLQGPVTRHLPPNSRVVGLSYNSEKLVDVEDYVRAVNEDVNLVFVVGARERVRVNKENTSDYIAVSNYPLSTVCCLGLICKALAEKWKIF